MSQWSNYLVFNILYFLTFFSQEAFLLRGFQEKMLYRSDCILEDCYSFKQYSDQKETSFFYIFPQSKPISTVSFILLV